MQTVLEFIDYIFDRYAFLGVSPDATSEELRVEIRRRRAENHPDKLVHVSDAIRKTAEREMDLVNDCARVLLDDALRERFNEKLAVFKETAPHLVSTSGTAIIDPSRFRLDLESLLDANITDISHLEAQATQMAGYNEKRLDRARSRFEKTPDDVDAREQLREQLTAKLVYLNVIEDYYWLRAGVSGAVQRDTFGRAAHSHEVLAHLDTTIEKVRSGIGQTVTERHAIAQLGLAPMLLLGSSVEPTESESITHAITTVATQAFELRIEDLKALVTDKKAVLDELLIVARTRQLKPASDSGVLDIMLIRSDAEPDEAWPGNEFVQMGVIMRLDRATDSMSPVISELSAEDLANWPNELYALEPNPEIPSLFMEAVALAERVIDERKVPADAS